MKTSAKVYWAIVAILAVTALLFPYDHERVMLASVVGVTSFAYQILLGSRLYKHIAIEQLGLFSLAVTVILWFAIGAGEGRLDLLSAEITLLTAVLTYLIFRWEERINAKQFTQEKQQ